MNNSILDILGIEEEVAERAVASLAGEMNLLRTGFYTATVKRVGIYKNKYKAKSLFAELEVEGETKMVSGSLKTKSGKTAEHIVALLVEISTAAQVELGEGAETSKGKVKDYGSEYSATIFDELAGTEVGLISVLSYNEEDDFKFKENLTVCQSDGTNAKDDDLKEKLEEKMEKMEEFEGYLAIRRLKTKSKTSNSKSGEASGTSEAVKKSASRI